jgi:predicted metal-dependent hydrolase
VIASWYREQVKQALPGLLEKWEPEIGVKVVKFFVRQMKTKWGSCNPVRRTIRLNSELAKKPTECLEYVLVHELIHIHDPTHNQRFRRLLTQHMPNWEAHRDELNRLPVRHENWQY